LELSAVAVATNRAARTDLIETMIEKCKILDNGKEESGSAKGSFEYESREL
jgi:hypothetical protein